MLFGDSGTLEWAWPWVLAAWPLPLLVWLLPPLAESVLALPVPFAERMATLATHEKRPLRMGRLLLAGICWTLLVGAAMRPQWVGEPVKLPVSGRSMMLAVDLSGSMREQDLELNGNPATRLAVVKSVLTPFIERREGDRLGLILFGDQPYLQTPLTFDRRMVAQMLAESEIGLAGERTALGAAVGLAVRKLRDLEGDPRVLVLLTDGRNTAGELAPEEALELAEQVGLRIYTIGVGADEAFIRTLFGTRRVNPSAELDETTLQAFAERTGGRYFRARSPEELEQIYAELDRLEPVEVDEETYRPLRELYPWPLAGALVFAVIGILIGLGFSRFSKKTVPAIPSGVVHA